MQDVYLWSAIVGCTLLLVQFILQVFGLGDADGDAGAADGSADAHIDGHFGADDAAHGTAGNVFFDMLSLKALVAFMGTFGLTGLSLEHENLSPFVRMGFSVLAGVLAMFLVAWMMRMLHSMGSSGSLVLSNALGQVASTYLHIPGAGQGQGKISLEMQGRSVELVAMTDGPAIPTGATVRVVEVLANETVKVERA